MLWLLMALLASATTPDAIAGAVEAFNRKAVLKVPVPTADQTQELLDGKVIRTLYQAEDPAEPSAAVAFMLTDVSRQALWIAAQDPHTQVDPDLTEGVVRSLGPDHAVWYGFWDLPRPIRDRQWVVESRNTHAVAEATSGKGWEHCWTLVPDGLDDARPLVASGGVGAITLEQLEAAIFTPTNHGSWFMMELEGGQTLYGYQATSVVGGAVPTWLVTKLVMSRMESLLRDLETRARDWSPKHYSGDHGPVYGGDGEPVPLF